MNPQTGCPFQTLTLQAFSFPGGSLRRVRQLQPRRPRPVLAFRRRFLAQWASHQESSRRNGQARPALRRRSRHRRRTAGQPRGKGKRPPRSREMAIPSNGIFSAAAPIEDAARRAGSSTRHRASYRLRRQVVEAARRKMNCTVGIPDRARKLGRGAGQAQAVDARRRPICLRDPGCRATAGGNLFMSELLLPLCLLPDRPLPNECVGRS